MRLPAVLTLFAALVAATPVPHDIEERGVAIPNPPTCANVQSTLAKSNCQPSASAYCTSYLGICAQTSTAVNTTTVYQQRTVFKTTATVTQTKGTITRTACSTTTPTVTVVTTKVSTLTSGNATSTMTSTSTVFTKTFAAGFTCTVAPMNLSPRAPEPVVEAAHVQVADVERDADLEERNVEERQRNVPKPRCMASYTKNAQISSACSCVATTPAPVIRTKFVTETKVLVTTSSVNATVGAKATTTTTRIETARVNQTSTITSFSTATVPSTTQTIMTTTTVTKAQGEYPRYLAIRTSSDNANVTGKYLVADARSGQIYYAEFNQDAGAQHTPFYLSDDCKLVNASDANAAMGSRRVFMTNGTQSASGEVSMRQESSNSGTVAVTCLADPATGALYCTNPATNFQGTRVCSGPGPRNNRWYLGALAAPGGLTCSVANLFFESAS